MSTTDAPHLARSQPYTRRLQRLLALVNEIKTNPRQQPESLYTALGVSRAQFYKDCRELAGLGFRFRYDRGQQQYVVTQDPFLPVLDLTSVAAQASVPVIPLAIRGTRSILRSGQWFPRRGAIRVTIGAPIEPQGSDWAAAVALRDQTRAQMLRMGGEPDLEHVTQIGKPSKRS